MDVAADNKTLVGQLAGQKDWKWKAGLPDREKGTLGGEKRKAFLPGDKEEDRCVSEPGRRTGHMVG